MIDSQYVEATSVMAKSPCGTDGTLDGVLRLGQKSKYSPAIFIHAGAGFHSHQNEKAHLRVCVAAANMGMKFLKAGATATEAVEASLRILEDKEITNAGYGSNLSIEGNVECDATIVDHLGRSGACGSVPSIRNPISVAKLILDMSNKPLSLRRIPPNVLVGEGAKMFAEENGIPTYPNNHLVSKTAHDRFLRWQDDLDRAEGEYDTVFISQTVDRPFPRDQTEAIMAGTGNEGQPEPPYYGTPIQEVPQSTTSSNYSRSTVSSAASMGRGNMGRTYKDGLASEAARQPEQSDSIQNGHLSYGNDTEASRGVKRNHSEADEGGQTDQPSKKYGHRFQTHIDGEDMITDTVGAIAVDEKGRIAAGSSSGGIGMKHRGRLGPAALVGIGTAVVPCAEDDEQEVTVAAVTSGTGEHMTTTMASQRCAERIYRGTRKGAGGEEIQDDDEDAVMQSFVANDFVNHPGVKNCHSAGVIGVMVVKKTPSGYYFYFAHNTDSFAVASMGAADKKPVCTMSRLSQGAKITKGGRKVRID